ncbi:Alpha amylase, catalytic domain-containing protein [Acidipropionibacterium acidipropionici ATCC 4875]|uniref:Alpha amylase, catalytic domain-containing protein n=2 Tax=Acidipropionibacterium acidipropionici TaxID=1748 RepID=K7SI55_ACIA4|nr:Alpha amylase, catalytic domain-containing protein [Acidipropionibacterium acidipropionici ATCC 4875]
MLAGMSSRPDWAEHLIAWHTYPLGLVGAPMGPQGLDSPVEHRLVRLQGWLDHVRDLGCSGLLLGPVLASRSHGYDTLDHYRVDPRLGDDADLDDLVAAAHERGLKVLMDGVFNHVSWHHRLVQEALAAGPDSPAGRMIRWRQGADGPEPDVFEGHGDLVTLNHDEPGVVDLVADVMNHWSARGIDGWRLDAAYAMPPAFWAKVLPRVRSAHPDSWVFGEVIHGDYPGIVAASGMDSVTQYELWKAIWSSIGSKNFYELDHALERHDEFARTFPPMTFIGNHDVTRIASQVGEPGAVLALAVLMTTAGVPSIYYGDEYAYRGVKEERIGGDDQIRPALPDSPQEVALGAEMLEAHRSLIGLRRRHPWLIDAVTEKEALANERYVYRSGVPGTEPLIVELDVTDRPWAVIREAGKVIWEYHS